jgi:hypothetical protein
VRRTPARPRCRCGGAPHRRRGERPQGAYADALPQLDAVLRDARTTPRPTPGAPRRASGSGTR